MVRGAFEVCVQKFLDHRIIKIFHFVGRANGHDTAFVDDGNPVGHAKRQVAVVRDDQRRDVNGFF